MAIVEGTDFGSAGIGNFVSGPVFSSIGYIGVFSISAASNLFSLIWIVFFLKESIIKENTDKTEGVNEANEKSKITSVIKTSLKYFIESFRTMFRSRVGYRRAVVLLGAFNWFCFLSSLIGSGGRVKNRLF